MTDTSPETSFFGNLVAYRQALISYDIDADEFIKNVGIDADYYRKTSQRIPSKLMNELGVAAVGATGDEAFGLRLVDHASPVIYHALGAGLLYSSTLRNFFRRFERFWALVTTMYQVSFTEDEETGSFTCVPMRDFDKRNIDMDGDAFCGIVLKYIRYIVRPDYTPSVVALTRPQSDRYAPRYNNFFGCEIVYDAPHARISVPRDDLNLALVASNAELARQNDKVVAEFLAEMQKLDLPTRVYTKLIELLPEGECTRDTVAREMNMSASTFHQKLKEAGTNYQEILDDTRRNLAENYMKQAALSTSEIAYLLGFTDSSNFSRAFRRWTGLSPREYRQNIAVDG